MTNEAEARPLTGRRILLGVTGSIAAYRAADLASKLVQAGAEVHVAMTAHALEFVGAATFRALTGNPVLTGVFDEPYEGRMAHIHIAQTCDLALVAPATANILAKMAHGIADDALSTLLLATTAPILVAPAMNTAMLEHPATQANLQILRERGVEIVEPGEGRLACGSEGRGRLADVPAILEAVLRCIARRQDLQGLRVLVTAGASREPLDPVRFLSNRSSGKMGVAIAKAAQRRGARVTLIAGHMTTAPPAGMEVVRFGTTREYLEACLAYFEDCDVFIGAAAPADYAPVSAEPRKIRKAETGEELTLTLRANPDVIAELAARKGRRYVVGFAAETHDLLEHAQAKLRDKGLDLIVANDVTAPDAGFELDTNRVTLLWPDGSVEELPVMTKEQVADALLDRIRERMART